MSAGGLYKYLCSEDHDRRIQKDAGALG